ncbi:Ku protein [Streptomyces mirabilis]|uniref:Ku protein n=1 Tax=Streptomyces mirabilis TaxID=68239 RepID=UPI0036DA9900
MGRDDRSGQLQIYSSLGGSSRNLQPQGAVASKPYLVLRHALERASKITIARYAWHGREQLGLLRVRGDVIALHGLLWPDEIRDPAALVPPPVQLDEDEIDEAMAPIEAMIRDNLTGPEFTDRYTEALHAVIEAKQEDHPPPEAPEPTALPGQLVDLMATLQESVGNARAAHGKTDAPKVPAKPAKKAPSRRASSRTAGRAGGRPGTPAR